LNRQLGRIWGSVSQVVQDLFFLGKDIFEIGSQSFRLVRFCLSGRIGDTIVWVTPDLPG
jgi:hypothetical protein